MDKITVDDRARAETKLWRPAKVKMIAHWNVAISGYDNGTFVATHARYDTNSGRFVFTRLSDPDRDQECPHYLAAMLAEAAQEVHQDCHADMPHL
jgi:hypothetical protein